MNEDYSGLSYSGIGNVITEFENYEKNIYRVLDQLSQEIKVDDVYKGFEQSINAVIQKLQNNIRTELSNRIHKTIDELEKARDNYEDMLNQFQNDINSIDVSYETSDV